jgi:uncharacterized protein YutE (UPF0331/DUF86 family)
MEAALQICFHISARELNRVPEHYAECFAILGEGDILPQTLRGCLKNQNSRG